MNWEAQLSQSRSVNDGDGWVLNSSGVVRVDFSHGWLKSLSRIAGLLIEEAQKNGARLSKACAIIGISQRSIQRWKHSAIWKDARKGSPKSVPKKLTEAERKEVIEIVNRPCFASLPPSQIVPILAEGGTYICSERSFYRILHECGMQHHRGKTKAPQPRSCPRLVATKKNQVYCWDITFLPTNVRGLLYYLYLYC